MKREKIIKNIAALLITVIIISVLYVYVTGSKKNIEKNKRYTIGCFFQKSWSGGLVIDYKYYVNGKMHKGGAGYNMDYDLLLGRCFFVKFSSKKPRLHKLLINMPVPDTISDAPPLGWDANEFRKLFGEEK